MKKGGVILADKYILEFKNVSKFFNKGKAEVFKNMSIKIPTNEIVGLIGENGSGKTTFIKLASGIMLPDGGDILINGTSIIKEFKKAKGYIGIMSDSNISLYMQLSGYENFRYFATLKGMINEKEREEKIQYLIDKLKMNSYINKTANSYSKGMRQRLLFAIAIVNEPKLLVLDEPLNGLDVENTIIIKDMILDLVKEKDVTILLTSHDKYFLDEISTVKYAIRDKNIILEDNLIRVSKELNIYFRKLMDLDLKALEKCNLNSIDDEKGIYSLSFKANDKDIYKFIYENLEANRLEILRILS